MSEQAQREKQGLVLQTEAPDALVSPAPPLQLPNHFRFYLVGSRSPAWQNLVSDAEQAPSLCHHLEMEPLRGFPGPASHRVTGLVGWSRFFP